MAKVFVMDHPLVQHKVTMLRDKNTSTKDFRELAEEISLLMAYEVTRDLPLEDVEVETPICKTVAKTVSGRSLGIVPILRAGLGMVNGMLKLVPNAKVGHIGALPRSQDAETRRILLQTSRRRDGQNSDRRRPHACNGRKRCRCDRIPERPAAAKISNSAA